MNESILRMKLFGKIRVARQCALKSETEDTSAYYNGKARAYLDVILFMEEISMENAPDIDIDFSFLKNHGYSSSHALDDVLLAYRGEK